MPPTLKNIVTAVSAYAGTPEGLAGIASIAIMSAAIGKGLHLRIGSQITRPNIFALIGGDSGGGKSTAVKEIIKPLIDYQAKKTEYWNKHTAAELLATKEAIDSQIQQLKRRGPKKIDQAQHRKMFGGVDDDGEEGPVEIVTRESEGAFIRDLADLIKRRDEIEAQLKNPYAIISEDVTEEVAVEKMAATGQCTFFYSADAAKVISNTLGQYKKNAETDESVYLKAFSGDPIMKDRIGRKASSVMDPCASLLWLTTPDRFDVLEKNDTLKLGGFMARTISQKFIITQRHFLDKEAATLDHEVIVEWDSCITDLLEAFRFAKDPTEIVLDDAAKSLLAEHHQNILNELENNPNVQDVKQVAHRWFEQTLKIAVVYHASHYRQFSGAHRLGANSVMPAIMTMQHFVKSYLAQYIATVQDEMEAKLEKAWKEILRFSRTVANRFYPSALCKGSNGALRVCRSTAEAVALLQEFVKRGRMSGPHQGARRAVYYEVVQPTAVKPADTQS